MEPSILDQNIGRLLSIAPERARLSTPARERIHAALLADWQSRAALSDGAAATSRTPAPRPRFRLVPATALAAAAALAFVLGWQALFAPGGGRDSSPVIDPSTELAGVDADARRPNAADGTLENGRPVRVTPIDSGGPQRAELELEENSNRSGAGDAEPGEGTESAATLPDTGASRPPREGDLRLSIALAPPRGADVGSPEVGEERPARATLPTTATVWIKPIVQLPQVADPRAYEVAVAWSSSTTEGEGGGAATASFRLDGGLEATRSMGATRAWVQAELPGFAPAGAPVSLTEAAEGTLVLDLQPGIRLSGEVLERGTGEPLAGAVVVAVDQVPLDALSVNVDPENERLPQPYAITDDLGRFELLHVAPSTSVLLRASAEGFAPTEISIDASSETPATLSPVRIALGEGAALTGIVERKDGAPFAGALVIASKQEGDPAAAIRPVMTFGGDTTDASGAYRIEGLPSGFYVVLLFDPTRDRVPLEFRQLNVQDASELRMDFRAAVSSSALTLTGTLIASDGRAAGVTALTLSRLDGTLLAGSDWRVTDTDQEGRFTYADLEPGEYALHTASDGFGRMQLVWVGRVDASQDLRLALADTSLRVDVQALRPRLSELPLPPSSTWVILERWQEGDQDWLYAGRCPLELPGPEGVALESPGANPRTVGTALLQHLPPGRYRGVLVGAGHGASWTEDLELEAGRPARAAVALRPGGRLEMTVFVDGKPSAGTAIKVLDRDGRPVPQREAVVTDEAGHAVYLSVPHGDLTVRVSAQGRVLGETSLRFDAASEGSAVEIRL